MTKRRRSRIEVIMDILSEARKGSNKTRIMYRCNLNFVCFNRYFKELLEKGLIVEAAPDPDGVRVYKTTDKGLQLLEVLKKAKDLISL